jgi:antitoxin (DNA-binding transcriptional repressor) of toxin-antitoxin stability system
MRVKIAELKTHLSKYIQSLRDGGEPIEVCVREKTVAYLTQLKEPELADSRRDSELAQRLEKRGLSLQQLGRISDRTLSPGEPGDGKQMENSIVAIRAEKEW